MVSDEYIRMSKEAKEIQDIWEPKDGNLLFISKSDLEFDEGIHTYWNNLICNPNFHNWNREWEGLTSPYDGDDEIIIDYDGNELIKKYGIIWLPRQEDLQEIALKNSEKEWHMVFIEFKDWFILSILLSNQVSMFNDLTELWLSFVMETCFDKTWTGNGWVKQ